MSEWQMWLPWLLIGAILVFNLSYHFICWLRKQFWRPPIVMPNAEQLRIQIIHDAVDFKRKLLLDIQDQMRRDAGSCMSEKRIVADGFVCLIERLKREGKLSDIRADWYYKQASLYLGLDTAPQPLPIAQLKSAIKTRLFHYHDLYFKPVPFPDRHRTLKDFPLRQEKPWKDD